MLQELVTILAHDPKNTRKMFAVAREYDRLEQGAVAISHYLKAADLENDDIDLQYRCLIYMSECYRRQRDRKNSVLMSCQHAVTLDPTRPEAYFLLCRVFHDWGDWRNMGIYAEIGLKLTQKSEDHITDIGYPDRWVFYFYRALANWKWKGVQVGKELLFNFRYRIKKGPHYAQMAFNLQWDEVGLPEHIQYTKSDYKRCKFTFPGLEDIENNYSAHFQDLFVLSVLKGKRNGTYVELGSGDPYVGNNTALLEERFGWRGLSIDREKVFAKEFSDARRNTVLCADSTTLDYSELFKQHCIDDQIDYLQVDVDEATLDTLFKIPFDEHSFGVITVEHDHYRYLQKDAATRATLPDTRKITREFLKEKGYVLLVPDVALGPRSPYEDWWVHPQLAESNEHMKPEEGRQIPFNLEDPDTEINFVWEYFMNTDNEVLDDVEEFI